MDINVKLLVGQSAALAALTAACLFLPAGTILWPAGWIFLSLFLSFFVGVSAWLIKRNPSLFRERARFSTPDQKGWDKVLFPLVGLMPFAWIAFASLDAAHLRWSLLPVWIQAAGALVLLGSFYLLALTFRENSYLSPVVRIQEDRGHQVVSTGPYHIVRHPMYTGILVFMIGVSLLLGSGLSLLVSLPFAIGLMRRAVLEERALTSDLPGYAEYKTQVKYRVIPYVW